MATASRSHPAHQRRAPLRRGDSRGPRRPGGHVIPPTSGGLHCGPSGNRGRALHSGLSSRPPAAGSIAARPGPRPRAGRRRRHPAHQRRAPLRRGAGPAAARHHPQRHPAHQRRAPLRHQPGVTLDPSVMGGHPAHQRRAPLRRMDHGVTVICVEVIPPTSGGLHCARHPARPRRAEGIRHCFRSWRRCGRSLTGHGTRHSKACCASSTWGSRHNWRSSHNATRRRRAARTR